MEYQFKSEEWVTLTPTEEAKRCRLMAAEAQALADAGPSDVAGAYLRIAEDWLMLAIEIEAAALEPN
jgi:hypothetical protein